MRSESPASVMTRWYCSASRVSVACAAATAGATAMAAATTTPTMNRLTVRRYARGARRASLRGVLLGVDVGGTFTDAVIALEDGRLVTAKAPSTPADQSEGVMAAVRAALERAERDAGDVRAFAHGMTVATNALLEGKVARTALVATEGFTDLVALGRQDRADLYRLCAAHPAPLVPAERRIGVRERCTPDGVLDELDDEEVARVIDALDAESVAVCLLHSYAHPDHERALGEALARRAPDVHVSLS